MLTKLNACFNLPDIMKERIAFEIDQDLKEKAEAVAEGQDLSLSQYCRRLIKRDVEATKEDASQETQPEPELTEAR